MSEVKSQIETKTKAKSDSIAETITQDKDRIYQGAYVNEKGMLIRCTERMTLQEARAWIDLSISGNEYMGVNIHCWFGNGRKR